MAYQYELLGLLSWSSAGKLETIRLHPHLYTNTEQLLSDMARYLFRLQCQVCSTALFSPCYTAAAGK